MECCLVCAIGVAVSVVVSKWFIKHVSKWLAGGDSRTGYGPKVLADSVKKQLPEDERHLVDHVYLGVDSLVDPKQSLHLT